MKLMVPESVNLSIDGNIINVKGKLGELTKEITDLVKVNYNDNKVAVKPLMKTKVIFLNGV